MLPTHRTTATTAIQGQHLSYQVLPTIKTGQLIGPTMHMVFWMPINTSHNRIVSSQRIFSTMPYNLFHILKDVVIIFHFHYLAWYLLSPIINFI